MRNTQVCFTPPAHEICNFCTAGGVIIMPLSLEFIYYISGSLLMWKNLSCRSCGEEEEEGDEEGGEEEGGASIHVRYLPDLS